MNTNGQKVSKVMTFIVVFACSMLFSGSAFAQRTTDKLDRGLIAMKVSSGVYINWRINAEEYYGVEYNVYRDGVKLNDTPLKVSNFTDKTGTVNSKYTVAAVVRGVEKPQCAPASVWSKSYKEIKLTHEGIKSTLVPNDACCADMDGDGEIDILMKFDNLSEMEQSYPKNGPKIDGVDTKEYSIFECLKQDGTRLWWVNCGPNMADFQNNEQNIVAYDWDGDGKAEAVMRLADGSVIHMADGTTYTVGNASKNIRAANGGGVNWFVVAGTNGSKEYLVYVNGETGKPYQCMEYPLRFLENGETDPEVAWGHKGWAHRSSKHFFGAPYLDGRKPSIFLARGIYTRHKMVAYDVEPTTHKLVQRWAWNCNANGPWKGQGYHNYIVADVDEDGRDEIVFGSMVIDDNGKGLSTTGLGHGDAQHVSDFNPYTKGLEMFACNEDAQGYNYRDATTSTIYKRELWVGKDVGRSMMGNFTDSYPGCIGVAWGDPISSVKNANISGISNTGINDNFRIYWDGDLCSETFNYLNGKNTEGCVAKYGSWSPIYTCEGSMTNNDTKGTPCYQGDILGDWREEIIMRTADNNIRIYSTPTATTYRIPTLWSDHQYRNAMVWQMCGYNQPPHLSYFLGKLEGITIAPPPLTMNGRTEVANGGVIDATYNDKHAIVCETNDTKVSLANGAKPYILTINVPSWVQGSAASNSTASNPTIKYNYYTCEVTDGYLDGEARLIKQGDGKLKLPKADFLHKGVTEVWAGTLDFDGTLKNSSLWLNRHTTLNSNGGQFRSITTNYASSVYPGGENSIGEISTDSLVLGFGSRLVFDVYSDGKVADKINTKYLSIERKTGTAWTQGGPKFLAPVIVLVPHLAAGEDKIAPGKYILGKVENVISGAVSSIILEGLATSKKSIYVEDGNLILDVQGIRDAASVVWTGATNSTWDLAETENFSVENEPTTFVSNDNVLFNDDAKTKSVTVRGEVSPSIMEFNSTVNYSVTGTGTIVGDSKFINSGTGTVTMAGKNTYTGGNNLKGGVTSVSLLSNEYSEVGNLGGVTTDASKFTMENGAVLSTTAAVEMGSPMQMVGAEGGVINNSADFVMDKAFSGTVLTKKGNGWLKSGIVSSLQELIVAAGTVDASARLASTVTLQGSSAVTGTGFLNTPIEVADKAKAKLTTMNRTTTNLALTGTGQITIYCATEKGTNYYATRTPIQLTLKKFAGTLVADATYAADGRFTFDTSNGGDGWILNIPASRYVQNTGKTLRIGQVTGTGELGGSCAFTNGASVGTNTWQVGNDGNFTFDGKVVSGDRFTKMGEGKMTVTGVWTMSGAVSIDAGTLQVKSGASLGTGTLTVGTNGSLLCVSKSVSSPMTNSSFTINGTLQVGINNMAYSGYTHFNNKNVTFGAKSRLILGLRKSIGTSTAPNNAYLTGISTLKITSGATIASMLISTYVPTTDPANPDKFVLWTEVKTANVGTLNFELPELPAWNYWDTSEIANGILYVRCNEEIYNAIEGIASDDIVEVDVTSMSGVVVDHFTCPMGSVKSTFATRNLKGIFVLNIVNEDGKHTSFKTVK